MGQGIIFVGANNLNRNKDHQSMYSSSSKKHYYINDPTLSRDAFYRELCEFSKSLPGKKKRTKRISQLRSKYQGNSCSEKMMERVFLSYFDCFTRTGVIRKNKVDLPIFLEKNKVDKRIIKRIREIENLNSASKKSEQSKTECSNLTTKQKRRDFYRLLHDYLIETTSNPKARMTPQLADYCKIYGRSSEYINELSLAYKDAIKKDIGLFDACKLRNINMFKSDQVDLTNKFYGYKRKHLTTQ